jgi:catechol 2,3-dioxygenase
MDEILNNDKSDFKIDPQTRIGHIHLKVSDLERSIKFYTEALGFEITSRMGRQAAFLSAGGYHHHIGLNTWESERGSPSPVGSPGLYHFAILLPGRQELARVLKRLIEYNWTLDGAADHGVSEALYLKDPDSNGIELYWDRPQEQWPRDIQGQPTMYTKALDLEKLLAELQTNETLS